MKTSRRMASYRERRVAVRLFTEPAADCPDTPPLHDATGSRRNNAQRRSPVATTRRRRNRIISINVNMMLNVHITYNYKVPVVQDC